ncbi:MAG: TldD/PmbA family protein [Dysgonomonas sp.]
MIENRHKEIAQWAMDYALKNGCQASRVSIIAAQNNSFEFRNGQLDKLQQSSENKLYIELFVDGRYGSFSTNRIEKTELTDFIKNGIESTRFLAVDDDRQLPDAARYQKNMNEEELDLFDPSYFDYTTTQKLDIARQTAEEASRMDGRIVSISSSFDDGCSDEYMIASNGFEGLVQDTAFSLTAEISLKTEGDARPESYWYDSKIYLSDLKKTGIATKALERVLQKIGQRKIKSGKYTMLLDNTVSSRLLSPIISAMYGASLQQKNSFLIDKLGQQIASSKLTLTDKPHIRRAFGARSFDGEGVATYQQDLILDGILNTYFIDTYNANKLHIAPTIASPSIIEAKTGDKSFEQLLQSIKKGIWVTGFNGGNSNPTTGDFSFGIEGFLVENGIPTQPLSEMNVTGNILSLWNNLSEIGNDPRDNSSWRIPSLIFEDVSFSGL